jgi:hypothetical protein
VGCKFFTYHRVKIKSNLNQQPPSRLVIKMRVPLQSFYALLIVAAFGAVPANGQALFSKSKIDFHTDFQSALNEAVQNYQGDLFVYFYDKDDTAHAKMDSIVFADKRFSQYVNDHFSTLALDMNSPEGRQVMNMYTPDARHDRPFIAVMSGQHLTHATFHGWEDTLAPASNEFGLADMSRKWLTLVSMKEYGKPPARPGETGWGRWSARVRTLLVSQDLSQAGR